MGQKRIIQLDEKQNLESEDVLLLDNENSGTKKISPDNLMKSKQDKTDNSLETTSKQIVGAINELKSGVDNTYTKSQSDTALASKQDKTDNSLQTTSKQIVGAINELIAVLADYYTKTESDTALALKQDKTDGSLNTNSKQIVGAINELLSSLSNFYTKAQVDSLIGAVSALNIEIVQALPTTDIDNHTIYFVPKNPAQTDNIYDEYMYINNAWELIGTTQVDLSNFYSKSEVDTLLAAKQNTLTFDSTPTANSNNPVKSGGIKTALDGKAPTSHASSATTYGVGTTANYGHVKVINGLTQSDYANGEALAAYQGKVLNDKISAITPAALGFGKGTCGTAAATAAKAVTLSGYNLVAGGIIAVKFTYAVPASATLNVNSKGAKSIYYRGAAITAGIIDAGDTAVFIYNGTQYDLLTTDKLMSMHF